jgi:hypothetical protein
MAPLKDKKKKKARRPKGPRKPSGRPFGGVYKTGMNRDIPMGGAGGSQNLIANLLASKQAQPPQVIQTPDQFKLAQDIKAIKTEQADIAEEVAVQRRNRNYGYTRAEWAQIKADEEARTALDKAAATTHKKAKSNIRQAAGAEKPKEEVAAESLAAANQAHGDAGNVVPEGMAQAPLEVAPDALGGQNKGSNRPKKLRII